MGNSILLISDDNNFANNLLSKLIFLRHDDVISLSDYSSAIENVRNNNAEIVLIHENLSKDLTLELIKNLRTDRNLCIILISSEYKSDFILSAYDCGIDDFILSSAKDFEFVVRIVNNIKHNSIKLSSQRAAKILEQMQVVDDLTGFYTYNYAKQIFENEILNNRNCVFMAVSPSNAYKSNFSTERFAQAVKLSIRTDDVVSLTRSASFYILLSNTDINGAIVVLNKIKENYGSDIELCAGISDFTDKTFDKLEADTLQAYSNALATNAEYVIVQNANTLDEWLNDENLKQKNYKIFRQMFNKKLQNVITPVFYGLQKTWEDKLFETEIEQYTNSEQCVFRLKNKDYDSTLRIVYTGFNKIIISVVHQGLDTPENSEEQLSLTKITQKELVSRVENFITDFKTLL